jgi:DNA-binding response OmpR family regulator
MRKKALIVHPDNAASMLMENWVRHEGYATQSVHTGNEAVSLALDNQVDLIVLDRAAPASENFDVILSLMYHPRAARIPVVFVNAEADALPIIWNSRRFH